MEHHFILLNSLGENVFSLKTMAKCLPKPVYQQFIKQMRGGQVMDKNTTDSVAHAARIWAMDRGATHFTHWFQPQTGSTAEKQDSFLTINNNFDSNGEIYQLDTFSGSQLLQSEPDASSFPSGGMRSTFEARALDEKTVLLRSSEALSKAAVELLKLINPNPTDENPHVTTRLYYIRLPPKHQQMEDHYFGRMPTRVLSAISEAELELIKLGVPVKTRHNEVAPSQFEMAPIFEEATIAVDHNLLTMDVLHKVAHNHKLKVLYHEKPFKGINGSGKHCNWSLSTNHGENLLDPTSTPETNYRFLLFLVAILNAVHIHAGLLRAGIASASNDHRLGANEAPTCSEPHFESIKVGGTVLDMKISTLPEILRDLTDRNRTSPFAFTVTLLNSAVASSIQEVTEALLKQKGDNYSEAWVKEAETRGFT
ncbi:unnamed protein product [Rhizophagus irregularis]|nr:unnamed protein product [Rhizophagus irregularis]